MGYTLQMPFCGFPRYLEWEHLDGVFWLKLECPQEHFLPGGALHALWKQTMRYEVQQAKTCATPGMGRGLLITVGSVTAWCLGQEGTLHEESEAEVYFQPHK